MAPDVHCSLCHTQESFLAPPGGIKVNKPWPLDAWFENKHTRGVKICLIAISIGVYFLLRHCLFSLDKEMSRLEYKLEIVTL